MTASTDRYAEVLKHLPGACLLVDGGMVVGANGEVPDVTGIPTGRLIGVSFEEFVVPEHQARWRRLASATDATPATTGVRLMADLAPVELTARRLPDGRLYVAVRSTWPEHYYSALGRAELTHDPLTGLANRFHLLTQLQERLNDRANRHLALVGLWIDELDAVVATNGERGADRVVKEVGSRLVARLRGPDLIGRYGQHGFLTVLTSDASVAQLTEIGGRLRDEVAFPVELDSGLASFTASVAVGNFGAARPSVQRIMSRLDDAAERLSGGPGNRTDVLSFTQD